jgi:CRISPR/Cas system-associated exonuclease Cas4 (RecB family)
VEVKEEELDALQSKVLHTISSIEEKKRRLVILYPELSRKDASLKDPSDFERVQASVFPATPVTKKDCGYCKYLGVCEVGINYVASKKKKSILTSGVTEIGLDDD